MFKHIVIAETEASSGKSTGRAFLSTLPEGIRNMHRTRWIIAQAGMLLIACAASATPPAFPGAEGFGAATPGGRGGAVYIVDTLADYDPLSEPPIVGSLRYALEVPHIVDSELPHPRTVVFEVAGILQPRRPLRLQGIRGSQVTVAGHSAPGGGVTITDHPLQLRADPGGNPVSDVVIRYLRFRNQREDLSVQNLGDGIDFKGAERVILDHVSCAWATDECISAEPGQQNNRDISIQNSLIAEVLLDGGHQCQCQHSRGLVWKKVERVSIHNNLFVSNDRRNPKISGVGSNTQQPPPFEQRIADVRFNLVYNWGEYAMHFDSALRVNFAGNRFLPGPDSHPSRAPISNEELSGASEFSDLYSEDNCWLRRLDGGLLDDCPANSDALIGAESTPLFRLQAQPITAPAVSRQWPATPEGLLRVGALPHDAADLRFIDELLRGLGTVGARGSSHDTILVPSPAPGAAAADRDRDGMPDEWETERGLDPDSPADAGLVFDSQGYTALEVYLNSRVTMSNDHVFHDGFEASDTRVLD